MFTLFIVFLPVFSVCLPSENITQLSPLEALPMMEVVMLKMLSMLTKNPPYVSEYWPSATEFSMVSVLSRRAITPPSLPTLFYRFYPLKIILLF